MAYIYKITNTFNNKIYIGSAKDYEKRWYSHKYHLNKGKHKNKKLQNAWNKYGSDNFELTILEEVDDRLQYATEQRYLNTLQPFDNNGYNIATDAFDPLGKIKRHKHCIECGELFYPIYRKQVCCSEDCEEVYYENYDWKTSRYERKNIVNWSVDDHLANYIDDRYDK